nr:hypothetical protein [uncultured Desulfuromonas sp.]
MVMHKRIRLTPHDRQKVWQLWQTGEYKVSRLAELYRVSRPTIYKILARARKQEFVPRLSVNNRFRSLKYGLKRLAKVERDLEEKRKREARRYNKSYPGELVHFDSKRLPLIKGEDQTLPREYLFVAIDDFSRELYAGIFPDKTQYSSELFLRQIADECALTPSNMPTQITAKSSKESANTHLLKHALNSVSVKSLRESLGRRPMEKLNESYAQSWRCGTSARASKVGKTGR